MAAALWMAHSSEDGGGDERGLLHIWRGYSCSVTPERTLLSRPVLQVALGTGHGLLLVEGGQVYSFGELPWKQSQGPVVEKLTLETSLSGQQVVAIAAGSYHSGAVTEGGGVHMWGDNGSGQFGLSALKTIANPTPVALLDPAGGRSQAVRVLELACGARHGLALSARREVWAWGSGCQLGLNTSVFPVWKPQKVRQLSGRCVLQVGCGAEHSLALVRRLGQAEAQGPPVDKCRQCQQLLYTMTDKEDHVIISDSHYCVPAVDQDQDQDQDQDEARAGRARSGAAWPSLAATPGAAVPQPASFPSRGGGSARRACPAAGSQLCSAQAPPAGPRGPRSSLYPDEQAVEDYPRELSDTQAQQEGGAGSQVRKSADPPLLLLTCWTLIPQPSCRGAAAATPSSVLNSLVASCASAVGERVASTYEAL
ncbi:unnamed protein product, partial [Tetraodon nigroviridis]